MIKKTESENESETVDKDIAKGAYTLELMKRIDECITRFNSAKVMISDDRVYDSITNKLMERIEKRLMLSISNRFDNDDWVKTRLHTIVMNHFNNEKMKRDMETLMDEKIKHTCRGIELFSVLERIQSLESQIKILQGEK